MLEVGITEPSAVVMVPKKNSPRWSVDYRPLNKVTRKDCCPLPGVDVRFIFVLSTQPAQHYWQVPLTHESTPKTALSAGRSSGCTTLQLLSVQ